MKSASSFKVAFSPWRRKLLKGIAIFSTPVTLVACGGGSSGKSRSQNTAPEITTQPVDQQIIAGQTAVFAVTATGTAPLSYQWLRNGVIIPDAINDTLVLPDETQTANGHAFTVIVSNKSGHTRSHSATLTILQPPEITAQPDSLTVVEGEAATFNVSASGTLPLGYQWRKDGEDIPSATENTYTTAPVQVSDDGTVYSVIVSNIAGSTVSEASLLSVVMPFITVDSTLITVDSTQVTVDSL